MVGGINSTFKLASLLKETEYQVHAHHVHLVNHEGRHAAEAAACRALRPKLKAIRDFPYTQSRIDHRQDQHIPFEMYELMVNAVCARRETRRA